jgi:DNA-binding CsgD family transcriptional regulator
VSRSECDRPVERAIDACYSAHEDFGALRARLWDALRAVVPFDAAFMATADPQTLLFTNAYADDALAPSAPLFLDGEFSESPDVNRFADLAHARNPLASLDEATHGDRGASARSREVMVPLGLGDELRVALRVDGTVWGFLCLHRSGALGFSAQEMGALNRVAPHAATAIRRLTASAGTLVSGGEAAVILVADHVITAIGGALDALDLGALAVGDRLPLPFDALVRRLEAIEECVEFVEQRPAAMRMLTSGGLLVSVHAARLHDATGRGPVVLTVGPVASRERSSLLLAAHGLTPAQRRVAELVLQGRTTSQIVVDLRISPHTVQDHLKVVFDKVGVRSRRDLVSALMQPAT